MKAVVAKKQHKLVSLSALSPIDAVIFEEKEIENAVTEFRKYLNDQWQEVYYLKLEK